MRDSSLIKKRDRSLVDKFHELYNVRRVRIEDALQKTAEEFYLSKDYVYKRIFYHNTNRQYYDSLQN